MRRLPLAPLIPISAASALVAFGCGGKATYVPDEVENDEDEGGSAGGNEGAPSPVQAPVGDPLSDENFNTALNHHVEQICVDMLECSGVDAFDGDCVNYFVSNTHRIYDTESPHCRGLMLDAFECSEDTWTCENQARACYDLYGALVDDCIGLYDDLDEY